MADLDDTSALEALDSLGVLDTVESWEQQCREGWLTGRAAKGLPDGVGVDAIIVSGMGGSGVAGDVVRAVVEHRLPLPFSVIKSYAPLPEWVGRNTLVVAVSYSGNTEETLEVLEDAHARGARIVTISSGGALADLAVRYGIAQVTVPGGNQPRASLGYLCMPLLGVLVEMQLIPDFEDDVAEALAVVSQIAEECHRKRPMGENPAKDLAALITGKVPVVYGAHGLGATAAYRFKCDLNEYGKTVAFFNELPEANHNEISGWGQLSALTLDRFVAVFLRDDVGEADAVKARFRIMRGLIEKDLSAVLEVSARGRSALARLLSLILMTQLAAIYVAFGYGIDPGPVEVIEQLKAELKKQNPTTRS